MNLVSEPTFLHSRRNHFDNTMAVAKTQQGIQPITDGRCSSIFEKQPRCSQCKHRCSAYIEHVESLHTTSAARPRCYWSPLITWHHPTGYRSSRGPEARVVSHTSGTALTSFNELSDIFLCAWLGLFGGEKCYSNKRTTKFLQIAFNLIISHSLAFTNSSARL